VVLQNLRLLVDLVPRKAHHLLQIQLQQPVVADHLQRHRPAGVRERRALVGLVGQEAEVVEALDHVGGRGGRDLHGLRHVARRDGRVGAFLFELVDGLEIVLDRRAPHGRGRTGRGRKGKG